MASSAKIRILTVGKTSSPFLRPADAEYSQRIGRYAQLSSDHVREASLTELRNERLVQQKEGRALLAKMRPDEVTTSLDRKGKQMTSEQLAAFFQDNMLDGQNQFCFVIGGPLGLDAEVLRRTQVSLSFSKMTLPHELAKVVLLEQLYRAFTILHGGKYHK